VERATQCVATPGPAPTLAGPPRFERQSARASRHPTQVANRPFDTEYRGHANSRFALAQQSRAAVSPCPTRPVQSFRSSPEPAVWSPAMATADRVQERRRAAALARHYRDEESLTIAEIARRLGRAPATVKAYLYDPTGEKARAVKRRYQGVCRGCGAPTAARAGKGDAYLRILQGLPSGRDPPDPDPRVGARRDAHVAGPVRRSAVVDGLVSYPRPPPRWRGTQTPAGGRLAGVVDGRRRLRHLGGGASRRVP
jgi:AraC-like DNA-binding protein